MHKYCHAVVVAILCCFATQARAAEIVFPYEGKDYTYAELRELRDSGEFERLERMIEYFRNEHQIIDEGNWYLPYFYHALSSPEKSTADEIAAYKKTMERWAGAYPESIAWRVLLIKSNIDWAWTARGTQFASEVGKDAWKSYRDYLIEAWKWVVDGMHLEQKDPELYRNVVTIVRGLQMDDVNSPEKFLPPDLLADYRSSGSDGIADYFFDVGVEVEPGYYYLYRARIDAFMLRWGGKPGELGRFLEEARIRSASVWGNRMYVWLFQAMADRLSAPLMLALYPIDWDALNGYLLDMRDQTEKKIYWLNRHCLYACMYQDRTLATRLFEEIGDDYDRSVWSKKRRFSLWREWALEDGHFPIFPEIETAIYFGNYAYLKEFLEKNPGLELNWMNEYGRPPLYVALRKKEPEMAELLIEHGAEVRHPVLFNQGVRNRYVLDFMLEHGVKPSSFDRVGTPLLYECVAYGDFVNLRYLIEKGGNPKVVHLRYGYTLLHTAAWYGKPQQLEYLLQFDVDRNAKTRSGFTAIELARDRLAKSTSEDMIARAKACIALLEADAG
jgi:Ankyrin repeats (many copies)